MVKTESSTSILWFYFLVLGFVLCGFSSSPLLSLSSSSSLPFASSFTFFSLSLALLASSFFYFSFCLAFFLFSLSFSSSLVSSLPIPKHHILGAKETIPQVSFLSHKTSCMSTYIPTYTHKVLFRVLNRLLCWF